MDLFDELFDGARNKKKTPAVRPSALDEALELASDEDDDFRELISTKKSGRGKTTTLNKRSREDDIKGPQAKKPRIDEKPKSKILTIALDEDSDDLEILPSKDTKSKSANSQEDDELKRLLGEADELLGITSEPSIPIGSAQHALTALQLASQRAAVIKAKLRETAAAVDMDNTRGPQYSAAALAQLDHETSQGGRALKVVVVDVASGRRVVLPVFGHWTAAQLRPLIANALQLNEANITLTYLAITIDETRTLKSLQVDNNDEIEVRTAVQAPKRDELEDVVERRVQALTQQQSADENEEEGDPDNIRLKIRVNKQDIIVALKKTDPMGKVIDALRKKFNVPDDGKVVLNVDGENVPPTDTPDDLALEDGDQVDAFITMPQEPKPGPQTRSRR